MQHRGSWNPFWARHIDVFDFGVGSNQDDATVAIPDVVAIPSANLSASLVENTVEPNQGEDLAHPVTDPTGIPVAQAVTFPLRSISGIKFMKYSRLPDERGSNQVAHKKIRHAGLRPNADWKKLPTS
jgi:hypothetical protein